MNLSDNHKQWAAWTITVLLTLAIALFFGVQYPLPEQPEETVEPVPLAAHFSNPVDIEGSASAGSPALTFQGDTDTGFWRSSGNTLNAATGGTEVLEIDSSGFTISSGTALDVATNATITGNLNLQGSLYDSTGATTVGDQLEVVGQENAQQLWVQGYTTQTANLFTAYSSALVPYFGVEGDGDVDARGNIHDGGGTVTFDDDLLLDGQADTNQLTVQGYTTQTNDLQVWEQSDGTDVAEMNNAGTFSPAKIDMESTGDIDNVSDLLFDAGDTAGARLVLNYDQQNLSAGAEASTDSSYIMITCSSAYTFTLEDGAYDGQYLAVIAWGPNTCTLDEDAGNHVTGGDLAFDGTAQDAAEFIWIDESNVTGWVCISSKLDN